MTDHDQLLRGALATCALASLLMSGSFFGTIWPERGWPVRIICVGLFGVLIYAFTGQIKAFNLDIPFDGYSLIGLVSYLVLTTGLAWFLWDRRTHRGR